METCRRNAISDGYIRLVVTRGPGDLGIDPRKCPRAELIVIARQLTMYAAAAKGIRVVTSTFRRNAPDATSPSIKSLNYLNNILARIEANDRGADEALMLDGQGYVAEATVDNFFIVTEQALLTPPTATNLKGITRETLLEVAASLGIKAEEKPFTLFDVWTSKEAFICGTGAEVVPVLSVDGRHDRRRQHRPDHRPHRRRLSRAWCDRRARRSSQPRPREAVRTSRADVTSAGSTVGFRRALASKKRWNASSVLTMDSRAMRVISGAAIGRTIDGTSRLSVSDSRSTRTPPSISS